MIAAAIIALAFGVASWMLGRRAEEGSVLALAILLLVSSGLPFAMSISQFPGRGTAANAGRAPADLDVSRTFARSRSDQSSFAIRSSGIGGLSGRDWSHLKKSALIGSVQGTSIWPGV